ncbi:hypothetical protein BD413DRAFT_579591 [Trametes elegans]|nr:hypothetical protein BD413DRAFT_579591 [Trametes elegans]
MGYKQHSYRANVNRDGYHVSYLHCDTGPGGTSVFSLAISCRRTRLRHCHLLSICDFSRAISQPCRSRLAGLLSRRTVFLCSPIGLLVRPIALAAAFCLSHHLRMRLSRFSLDATVDSQILGFHCLWESLEDGDKTATCALDGCDRSAVKLNEREDTLDSLSGMMTGAESRSTRSPQDLTSSRGVAGDSLLDSSETLDDEEQVLRLLSQGMKKMRRAGKRSPGGRFARGKIACRTRSHSPRCRRYPRRASL